MQYADVLNTATEWPSLPAAPRFKDFPDRAAVLMCKPPERSGEIILPDRLSGNLAPDAGVVAMSLDIPVGTRVYVRPYVGMHLDTEEGRYRLLGRERFQEDEKVSAVPIFDHILAFDENGEVTPSPGNLLVELLEHDSKILRLTKDRRRAVIVMTGQGSEFLSGWIVPVVSPDQLLKIGDRFILPESATCEAHEQAA